jgi:exonuclease III
VKGQGRRRRGGIGEEGRGEGGDREYPHHPTTEAGTTWGGGGGVEEETNSSSNTKPTTHAERGIISWNMGGGWDGPDWGESETVWDWIYRFAGMRDGAGGVVCLQDTRIKKEDLLGRDDMKWWAFRDETSAQCVAPVIWRLARVPTVKLHVGSSGDGGCKEMGGTFVLAWGDVARGAKTPKEEGALDEFGRWAALELTGEGGRKLVVVSVYKPPRHCGSESGGMMARMIHLRKWTGSWADKVVKANAAFYDELGNLIGKWKERDMEVVVCGDLNEEWTAGGALHTWASEHGIVDARTAMLNGGHMVLGEEDTYFHPGNKETGQGDEVHRKLDYILMSRGIREEWLVGSLGRKGTTWTTDRPAGRDLDHRAIKVWGPAMEAGWWVNGGQS